MKQNIFKTSFFVAVCSFGFLLGSCHKEDTPEITQPCKLVSKVNIDCIESPDVTYSFFYDITYNSENKFASFDFSGYTVGTTTAYPHNCSFSIRGNQLFMKFNESDYSPLFWLNEDGNIITSREKEIEETLLSGQMEHPSGATPRFANNLIYVYEYEDGFLKRETRNGQPVVVYTWANGDMIRLVNLSGEDADLITIIYSEIENKMNLNPVDIIFDRLLFSSSGYNGLLSKHLPSKYRCKSYTGWLVTISYTYEFDDEGYPVTITALEETTDDEGVTETTTQTAQISYTE